MVDSAGRTALTMAQENSQEGIAEILEAAGDHSGI